MNSSTATPNTTTATAVSTTSTTGHTSSSIRKISDYQEGFQRQAQILRKNLYEWDRVLTGSGEDWPSAMGRLNAALSQVNNVDREIQDVFEHFVYQPKKSTISPQDIPFFLSTRIVVDDDLTSSSGVSTKLGRENQTQMDSLPTKNSSPRKNDHDLLNMKSLKSSKLLLDQYEEQISIVSNDYEMIMERF